MYNDLVNVIEKKYKDLAIIRINTTKYYEMKEQFKIKKIPSFVLLKDDNVVSKYDGMTSQYSMINWIKENRG